MRATNLIRRGTLRAGLRLLPSESALHHVLARATLATDIASVTSFPARTPAGHRILLSNPANSIVARKVYWFGARNYEPGTSRIIEAAARQATTFLDLGANVGYYALLAAAANPKLSVFAFEPAPGPFHQLQLNVELNRMTQVTAIQAAVGNFIGNTRLYLSDNDCSASIREGFREAQGQIEVPVVTVDQFVEDRGIARVDLIKLDVEGVEDRVLQGAHRVLQNHRPTIICEVLAGRTEEQLQTIMDAHRYEYSLITPEGPVPRKVIQGDRTYKNLNYLFAPID